jgi:hypothetical protein
MVCGLVHDSDHLVEDLRQLLRHSLFGGVVLVQAQPLDL